MTTSHHDVNSNSQLVPPNLLSMYQSDRDTPDAQASQSQVSTLLLGNRYPGSSIWDLSMMIGWGLEDALSQSISPSMSLTDQQEPITSACSLFEPLNNFALSDSEILDHHDQPWHIPLAARCVTRMTRSQLGQITSIIDQASQDTESGRKGFSNISALYLEASLQSLPINKRRPTITMPHPRRLHNNDRIPELPGLYRNHLHINRINLYAACMANSNQLGVPNLLAKSKRLMSPFCQSLASQVFFSAIITPSNTSSLIFGLSSPALSATRVLYQSSTFHARLLAILSLSPPVINNSELKADLDADGIVCWGSAGGGGRRGRCGVL